MTTYRTHLNDARYFLREAIKAMNMAAAQAPDSKRYTFATKTASELGRLRAACERSR